MRLIHHFRHKLIRQPSQRLALQPASSRHLQTGLQQYHKFVRTNSRKRAAQPLLAPQAKKAHTWVRSNALPTAAAASSAATPVAKYVRSTHSRKLQLVRQCTLTPLRLPSTPISRVRSRGSALAKHLLSVRSLKRRPVRRSVLSVTSIGIAKPGRLQRIDGVLYKVGGSRLGKTLQRQLTPKVINASEVRYQSCKLTVARAPALIR